MNKDKYKVENKSNQVQILVLSDGSTLHLLRGKSVMLDSLKMSDSIKNLSDKGLLKLTFLGATFKKVRVPATSSGKLSPIKKDTKKDEPSSKKTGGKK
jgi:hypothetical protein